MLLSNNMGGYLKSFGHTEMLDECIVLEKLHAIGWRCVDFSFNNIKPIEINILWHDDWEARIARIREMADRLGMEIRQCHFPSTKFDSDKYYANGYNEYFEECMRRAYIAAGMLGVKWGALHPRTFAALNHENQACKEANHAFYDKYIELGIKLGVGTALENMLPPLNRNLRSTRYCTHYDQLIELADSYNDPLVGICWDTGHANQMRFDQVRALRAVGKRLKAVHLNDNHFGARDEHLIPFLGELNWYDIMAALAEIGYEGTLNFETSPVGRKAPRGPLQDALAQATYVSAQLLLEIYEEAAAKLAEAQPA